MSNAAGILFLTEGRVLLLLRNVTSEHGGEWAFPGGTIEPGELPIEAAIRETFEEVGHVVEPGALRPLADDGHFVSYLVTGQHFTPTLNSEHTASVWAKVDELPSPLHPGITDRIREALTMTSARRPDANGFIEIENNPISRAGVFQYLGRRIPGAPDPDRIYNVYRPPEELGDPETIESFRLLPFTNDHPSDMLGSESADLPNVDGKPAEGVIGERVYFKDGFLYGNLKLYTDRIGQALKAGKREVSAGFRCLYEYAPGVFDGQAYEYIQRRIRGNHVALVDRGRAGPEVAVLDHFTLTYDTKEGRTMADEKTAAPGNEGDTSKNAMSLEDLIKIVSEIAPQVKALTDAVASLSNPADPASVEDAPKPVDQAAMDALEKRVASLEGAKPVAALDAKDVFAAAAKRDSLYNGVSRVIGAFDCAEMDAQGVAAYAVGKLGLNVPAGSEIIAVESYLAANPSKPVAAARAMDNGDTVSPIRQHIEGATA